MRSVRRRRPAWDGRRWLTSAARRQAAELRAEWLGHATSTEPADRPTTERAIGRLYRLGSLAPPRFVWVDSPAGAALAVWLLAGSRNGYGDDRTDLDIPFDEVLADPVWETVGYELRDAVWAALERGLADRLDRTGPRRNLLAFRLDAAATAEAEAGGKAGAELLRAMVYRPSLPGEVHNYYARMWTYGADQALAELDARFVRTLASPPAKVSSRARAWLTRPLPFPGDTSRLLHGALTDTLGMHRLGRDLSYGSDGRGERPPPDGLWRPLLRYLLDELWTVGEVRTGQADADGICADQIFRRLGIVRLWPECERRLDLLAAIAKSSGPWLPFSDVCVVVERPVRLRVEPWGAGGRRLHSMDGAALGWRDGFGVHAWHGVRVPASYNSGQATAADWRAEPNSERRRLLAERIGYARLLEESRAERIATDDFGTLWRIPAPAGEEDLVVVDVLNSTRETDGSRRRYVLRVPPDQRVPRDAIGWTFGMAPGTYQPTDDVT